MVGIDTIMRRLRPDAKYQISNNSFSFYEDPSGLPQPTWLEIQTEINEELKKYQELIVNYVEATTPQDKQKD